MTEPRDVIAQELSRYTNCHGEAHPSELHYRMADAVLRLHPLNWEEEVQASIEVARAEGRPELLAPILDLIGWWETDGTESRKAAAERIRGVLRADAGGCDCQ